MTKRIALYTFLIIILFSSYSFGRNTWTRLGSGAKFTQPENMSASVLFSTNENELLESLFSLSTPDDVYQIDLPLADGTTRKFNVRYTPVMPDALASRYPDLRTFTAWAVDDPNVTAKLDYTVYGFHAMIFDGGNISFVDPSGSRKNGLYTAHYKKDEQYQVGEPAHCATPSIEPVVKGGAIYISNSGAYKFSNGYQLRTYRLALSCSHQYAAAATGKISPTIAEVLSKMTTTINRVNGVYERELSATMVFISNEDTLIWVQATGGINGSDPFDAINSNASACLDMNQTVCDARIGAGNYDLGHVFTTGAGGYSEIGVICNTMSKARSVTGRATPTGDGFDIDFVAHEMGHQFGAEHTFNGSSNLCGNGNGYAPTAYEPGSGSTIMAYAGICNPDDVQAHSDDYFHAVSLYEIQRYLTNGGSGCGVKTPTGNKLVFLPPFKASYNIPFLTPFELIAPAATDSVTSSSITYCWEQWNLGDFGQTFTNTHNYGPIFRSYPPVASPTRIFPKINMVLADSLTNAGHENAQGEKAPDVARVLTFRLTMRNLYNGYGCFLFPDDSISLNVINTGAGFKVTSQADSTITYVGNSNQSVTWNVVGTDAAPVNASTVEIYMSEDGGYTWPHHIGTFPNTGSAVIPLPNPDTTTTKARIKVKGSGNVFFNINRYNFSVTHGEGTDTAIRIYPNPTHATLRINSGNAGQLQFRIYNSVGQLCYANSMNGVYDVPVYLWARGVYLIRMIDLKGRKTVKKFVID